VQVIHELADKLRKAARNGSRLHLEQPHVRALLSPRIYEVIASLEAEELNALCLQDNEPAERKTPPKLRVISSETSGSGIGGTAMTGAFAGTTPGETASEVGHAASRSASAAVMRITRQKQPKTP
jgi:hypothetical protein